VSEKGGKKAEKGRDAGRASAGKGIESWKRVNVYMNEWDNRREIESVEEHMCGRRRRHADIPGQGQR